MAQTETDGLEVLETREWVDSLDYVLSHGGPNRAGRLLQQLGTNVATGSDAISGAPLFNREYFPEPATETPRRGVVTEATLAPHLAIDNGRRQRPASCLLNTVTVYRCSGGVMTATTLTDRQIADELRSTLKEINALAKDMKEHPKKYFSFSLF